MDEMARKRKCPMPTVVAISPQKRCLMTVSLPPPLHVSNNVRPTPNFITGVTATLRGEVASQPDVGEALLSQDQDRILWPDQK